MPATAVRHRRIDPACAPQPRRERCPQCGQIVLACVTMNRGRALSGVVLLEPAEVIPYGRCPECAGHGHRSRIGLDPVPCRRCQNTRHIGERLSAVDCERFLLLDSGIAKRGCRQNKLTRERGAAVHRVHVCRGGTGSAMGIADSVGATAAARS
jgi:hypothetical protein